MLDKSQPLAILIEGYLGRPECKMAIGMVRYCANPIVCVIDPAHAGKMLSVVELDRIGREAFLGRDMNTRRIRYAQAGFLTMFLLDGKRAGALRRLVREVYCGENRTGLIREKTGEDPKKIDREFRRFVRSL